MVGGFGKWFWMWYMVSFGCDMWLSVMVGSFDVVCGIVRYSIRSGTRWVVPWQRL